MAARLALLALVSLWSFSAAGAAQITLAWDPNTEPDLAGYRVYYGTASHRYPFRVDVGTFTSCTIADLQEGKTYYFTATAYDTADHESGFSAEIVYTVPMADSDGDGVADSLDAFPQDAGEWRDTDGDGLGNNIDDDDDNDGMPDDWEVAHLLDPLVDDGAADADGDGISNLEEYIAGTHPKISPDNRPPAPPERLLPDNGALVPLTPMLETRGFADPDAGDRHAQTRWRIIRKTDNLCVLDVTSTSALTRLEVPALVLEENTAYTWQAQFFDQHGAPSTLSAAFTFTTLSSGQDADGNGIPDAQEVDPATDLDADGTPDVNQHDLKCVASQQTDARIGLSFGGLPGVDAIDALEAMQPDIVSSSSGGGFTPQQLPLGLIGFKLKVKNPGQPALVRVLFSRAAPAGSRWYKLNPVEGAWRDFSSNAQFSPDRRSVLLQLRDGGPGDADGIENGIIVDPSGPAVTDDGNSSDNNGSHIYASCFISTLDHPSGQMRPALLVFMLLGAMLVVFLMVLERRKASASGGREGRKA